jgi:hypothetical protein
MSQVVPHCPPEQIWALPQLVPSAMFVYVVVLFVGWHVWQTLLGFAAAGATTAPPMKQPAAHTPIPQTSPVPHPIPSAMFDHIVVLVPGWHD